MAEPGTDPGLVVVATGARRQPERRRANEDNATAQTMRIEEVLSFCRDFTDCFRMEE
jgi:hypothetical protein